MRQSGGSLQEANPKTVPTELAFNRLRENCMRLEQVTTDLANKLQPIMRNEPEPAHPASGVTTSSGTSAFVVEIDTASARINEVIDTLLRLHSGVEL